MVYSVWVQCSTTLIQGESNAEIGLISAITTLFFYSVCTLIETAGTASRGNFIQISGDGKRGEAPWPLNPFQGMGKEVRHHGL